MWWLHVECVAIEDLGQLAKEAPLAKSGEEAAGIEDSRVAGPSTKAT